MDPTEEGDETINKMADSVITVPQVNAIFSPVINTVALQLLTYYVAKGILEKDPFISLDKTGVGQLVLFHLDPNYADKTIASIENQARKVFANTLAAREGQMIKLGERRSQPKMEDTLPLAKIQQRQPRATNWASA